MTRRIVSTEDTCGGNPRVEGTRLTCANIVQTLTFGEMSLREFLTVYDYLTRQDVAECVEYCAARKCISDRVVSYCQQCSLDESTAVGQEAEEGGLQWEDEEKLDIWLHACELLRDL
ncbi:DUF433 domain-containing protein [Aeoliella mucimassa]|uniref:DUF433 domain-containing protein n=1 Tax=Aeoliella mucimassa TaxID=2527972 RepID=A0A518APY3_9BACT|nr:DUF433 domain-containing protein [Aeoliella mucimassa]QDU56766.1 hypothetical protein Pan181_29780 [Aeoliella mucimassa]